MAGLPCHTRDTKPTHSLKTKVKSPIHHFCNNLFCSFGQTKAGCCSQVIPALALLYRLAVRKRGARPGGASVTPLLLLGATQPNSLRSPSRLDSASAQSPGTPQNIGGYSNYK